MTPPIILRARRAGALAVLAVLLAPLAAAAQTVTGFDHFAWAVRDLDGAAADFAAMGFTVKPGRPHDNGIASAHLKFADGTYIELITAPAAVDTLTGRYVAHLQAGEGPAFHGLRTPDADAAARALAGQGAEADEGGALAFAEDSPLYGLFVTEPGPASATDRPEHVVHANTAAGVGAVWLAGADAERAALAALGAEPAAEARCHPFDAAAPALRLADGGSVVFLPEGLQTVWGRRFMGLTVMVGDLAAARVALDASGAAYRQFPGCGNSLWLTPAQAHGGWLELRQAP